MSEPAELLGLLAEPDRLRVVAALVLGAATTAEVAEQAGIDTRDALRALNRLVGGGLVSSHQGRWSLYADRFRDAARAAAPPVVHEDHGAADAATAAVLRAFVKDGRLVSVPAARAKRRGPSIRTTRHYAAIWSTRSS